MVCMPEPQLSIATRILSDYQKLNMNKHVVGCDIGKVDEKCVSAADMLIAAMILIRKPRFYAPATDAVMLVGAMLQSHQSCIV